MDEFDLACAAVNEALAQNRIGTPVAVRLLLLLPAEFAELESALDRALDAVSQWLASNVVRLQAQGSQEQNQLHVQSQFAGGQTALVTVAWSPSPRVDLLVVGNRGTICWETDSQDFSFQQKSTPAQDSRGTSQWLPLVRQSLQSSGALVARPPSLTRRASSAHAAATLQTPLKPPYGLLLIAGAYTHQEMYAKSFAEDPRCRLVGLTDSPDVSARRKELNTRLALALNVPLLDDLGQALAREDVHIVSVCAEPERRAEIILRCAKAGKHVYLDKPLAATLNEAEAIVAALEQSKVIHQMFSLVHTNLAARVRRAIESGQIGALRAVHADVFFAKGPSGTATLGKPRVESAQPTLFELPDAKRELYNVGVYPLVMLEWLLGRTPQRVFASTGNYFFSEHQKHDMEDFGQISLQYADGLVASISAGRTGWRSHPMGGVNRVCLIGSKGALTIDAFRPRLEVWTDEEPWLAPARYADDPMAMWASTQGPMGAKPKRAWVTATETMSDVRHFVDCVERGIASDVPADVGAAVLQVLLVAYQSAATGEVVELSQL